MQKEHLSSFVDGENYDSEWLAVLDKDTTLQKKWQSYHLIRDTLRGDIHSQNPLCVDIAAQVAKRLEQEPIRIAAIYRQTTPDLDLAAPVPSTSTTTKHTKKSAFLRVVRPFAGQAMQIGIAASVALAVLTGVQFYQSTSSESRYISESPAFNTLPLFSKPSPVSLGVPTKNTHIDERSQQVQQQEQHRKANSILQDFELQRRLYQQALSPAVSSNAQVQKNTYPDSYSGDEANQ
jgi:sigma-E factor negative regulatory protein RseA